MKRQKVVFRNVPAPAQDILTVLDILLQLLNVIEAVIRVFSGLFTSE